MSEKKTNRRDFLFTATYAVGAVGVGATVWPMIDQMNPDASVKALASTEVDVSAVNPGNTITVLWRGKPVFIRRRTADEIAEHAEFFSFGTNDLTQTTFGFSRDDIGSFLPDYLERSILPEDPFQSLDVNGVGKLVSMAVKLGRNINDKIKIGICGEHGGDPASIHFCKENELDYVSCSPFRVPIARLSAAQAEL